MSLYRRKGSSYWWVRFMHNGRRVQQSSGTADREKAKEYHDNLKAELWDQERLGVKPRRSWNDAVVRWLRETSHKATHEDDVAKLRWLDQYLGGMQLHAVTSDQIGAIAGDKAKATSPSNANHFLSLIRAILRRAWLEWEWIDRVPRIRLYKVANKRIRWITREEAQRLIELLPDHQAELARFALNTGLRQGNVLQLEWSQIDLPRRVAWVHPDQAKARKAIGVPLNDEALEVIRRQLGKHQRRVFAYKGKSIGNANTRAWRNALREAGIENFRWHDLRHTWASWHVQAGTSLLELKELGGWETLEMVQRYAHLAPNHLAAAAARIAVATKVATVESAVNVGVAVNA